MARFNVNDKWRGIVLGPAIGIFCALLVAGATQLGWLRGLARLDRDAQFQMRGYRASSNRVVIVAVDDPTITGRRWPLPRDLYADVIRRLTRAGARTIAFDIFFTAPSDSPHADNELIAACAQSGRVIQAVPFGFARDATRASDLLGTAGRLAVRFQVTDRGAGASRSPWASAPLRALAKSAVAIGSVTVPPDPDGVLRAIPHLVAYTGPAKRRAGDSAAVRRGAVLYPSLALAAVANYWGLRPHDIVARPHEILLPAPEGMRHLPIDNQGRTWINWIPGKEAHTTLDSWTLDAASFPTISCARLIGDPWPTAADVRDFSGKIVLIGVTAAGAFERHATPFSSVQPAVELQANAIDDILTNRALQPVPRLWGFLLLVALTVAIGFAALRQSAIGAAMTTSVLGIGLWLIAVELLHHNWFLSIAAPLLGAFSTYGLATGFTSMRGAARLRQAEERYALAVRGANDGLWDWNLRTYLIYFSPRWKQMLGYTESEIGDHPNEWYERVHPDDLMRLQHELQAHLQGVTAHFENQHRIFHKDGHTLWVKARGLRVCSAEGIPTRMAGSLTDISDHKQAQEQLERNAFFDDLTGLPNRALFMDRLDRSLARTRRRGDYQFAVLFMDVDRFKVINDSLGHMKGDQLLIQVGRCLESCLRPGDTAARLGGDEFTILLDDVTDIGDATRVVTRIQQGLARPFDIEGYEVFPTVSIGIAISTPQYEQPEDLLRDADTAMYRAKALGRARHEVFDEAMHAHAISLLRLETDLRRALERQNFQVYYQPIISLDTLEVTGFEALARWNHPERGLVAPNEFIALAEETGLIIPLDQWILREACTQTRAWQQRYPGRNFTISANLSGKQFTQGDLVGLIQKMLIEVGLPPANLKLEITEGVIMNNPDAAAQMLLQLKALGIQLSIDDFGTGYSSLSYLHRFPLDTLKIDQSFVSRMEPDGENSEIVRTIIALARNFNMETIAEGVETPEQLAQLKELQCNYAQGYLFARPLPADQAEELLAKDGPCAMVPVVSP